MTQLASVRFAAQTPEEILTYLTKSAQDVSSEKITQGIAISILDKKRPENSGTLMKYIRAKCNVEIAPHAFSVAVSFSALNGTGTGFVEESKFVLVPLKWHLHASAIINLVAKPEANLDDAGRAGVHEEIAEIFRTKPEKGEDLLKLIKNRFKPVPAGGTDAGDGDPTPAAAAVVELPPVNALSDEYIKAIGFQAAECKDPAALTRVAQLLEFIRQHVVVSKLAELGVTEEITPLVAPAPEPAQIAA